MHVRKKRMWKKRRTGKKRKDMNKSKDRNKKQILRMGWRKKARKKKEKGRWEKKEKRKKKNKHQEERPIIQNKTSAIKKQPLSPCSLLPFLFLSSFALPTRPKTPKRKTSTCYSSRGRWGEHPSLLIASHRCIQRLGDVVAFCQHGRRYASLVAGIRRGPGLEQVVHHLHAVVLTGEMERSRVEKIALVDTAAVHDE